YDFSVGASHRFPGKGKDEWKSEELIKMIRQLQPRIILNDRLQIDQDVKTPEQYQPSEWVTVNGQKVVWEACQTFSGSWGYHRDESTWKSPEMLIKMLINSVSTGGNLLLNVGPTGRGEFDERALSSLKAIGEWMKRHNRSIYGCTQAPEKYICPKEGKYTFNPETNRLYLHVYDWPFGVIHLNGMAQYVDYIQLLNDASELKYHINGENIDINIPIIKPNVTIPVIEIYLK
ncbi:MAG: Alpha-L-fucosidase, partial [Clostridia bacterium]|nr:Alpha-L-fucosidase [Clostridia bacterium]